MVRKNTKGQSLPEEEDTAGAELSMSDAFTVKQRKNSANAFDDVLRFDLRDHLRSSSSSASIAIHFSQHVLLESLVGMLVENVVDVGNSRTNHKHIHDSRHLGVGLEATKHVVLTGNRGAHLFCIVIIRIEHHIGHIDVLDQVAGERLHWLIGQVQVEILASIVHTFVDESVLTFTGVVEAKISWMIVLTEHHVQNWKENSILLGQLTVQSTSLSRQSHS